jgi:hypothetical protein
MRPILASLLIVALAGACQGEDKAPSSAKITMTGKREGFISVSSSQTVTKTEGGKEATSKTSRQLTITLFRLGEKVALPVALPAKSGEREKESELKDLLKQAVAAATSPELVAVEGKLGTSEEPVIIALAGAKGVKRVPILMADKVIKLTDKNKKDYPPENAAVVEGAAVKGKVKFGSESTEWAIQDGERRIPILLGKGVAPPTEGRRVRVTGAVRLDQGTLAIEAKTVEPVR